MSEFERRRDRHRDKQEEKMKEDSKNKIVVQQIHLNPSSPVQRRDTTCATAATTPWTWNIPSCCLKTKKPEVDSFTEVAFKGNPAAVCLLDEERDDKWMLAVARDFNVSQTCFLTRITESVSHGSVNAEPVPRYSLRWFSIVAEVPLCGHGTLAAAHFLFTSGLVRTSIIEFSTLSGTLTATKFYRVEKSDASRFSNGNTENNFSIELDFPASTVIECDPDEIPSIPKTLNGVPMINIKKMDTTGDLIVELPSGEDVADLKPVFDEIQKCPGRGVLVTAVAPRGSGFDFFSRFFCPKLGVNEDPVCGSAHCVLAPYWSKKLGKCDFLAFMASRRGGALDLHLDEEAKRLLIRSKAVTIMEGSILA